MELTNDERVAWEEAGVSQEAISYYESGDYAGYYAQSYIDANASSELNSNSLHNYVTENYQEEWSNIGTDGFFTNSNWTAYENAYNQALYSPHRVSYDNIEMELSQRLQLYQSIENERAALMGETPRQLAGDQEFVDSLREAVTNDLIQEHSDAAAHEALFGVGMDNINFDIDAEDINQMYEDATLAQREAANEKQIKDLQDALENREPKYLCHGALLCCNCGSHYRYLRLKLSHGVYAKEHAIVHCDNTSDYNIPYMGHCDAPSPPPGGERIDLKPFTGVDWQGNRAEQEEAYVDGFKCVPDFDDSWINTDPAMSIANEGNNGDFHEAITMRSYIMCKNGGMVYALTDGQEEFVDYTAPYAGCPFPQGSEVFKRWCAENGVCPFEPGTDDYHNWYNDEVFGPYAETRSEYESLTQQIDELESRLGGAPNINDWDYRAPTSDEIEWQMLNNQRRGLNYEEETQKANDYYNEYLNGVNYAGGYDNMTTSQQDAWGNIYESINGTNGSASNLQNDLAEFRANG